MITTELRPRQCFRNLDFHSDGLKLNHHNHCVSCRALNILGSGSIVAFFSEIFLLLWQWLQHLEPHASCCMKSWILHEEPHASCCMKNCILHEENMPHVLLHGELDFAWGTIFWMMSKMAHEELDVTWGMIFYIPHECHMRSQMAHGKDMR